MCLGRKLDPQKCKVYILKNMSEAQVADGTTADLCAAMPNGNVDAENENEIW